MTFIALVPPVYYNVKNYGAAGDVKTVTDGAITTGTASLTSSTAGFTSADVGKLISVVGAGTSGANLNTTISAYVSTTQVSLTANASTTVSSASVTYGTDDTTAISNARSAANTAGGGIAFYPAGTYFTGNQTLYPNVRDVGAGRRATTLKLKNGANTDLFSAQTSSINLSAAFGSGIIGTLLNFSIENMSLDGNKANQTSGLSYPLRFYGYDFIWRDVEILNGYSGGILCDWNGGSLLSSPSDNMEGHIEHVKIHDCNGIGLQMGGPHDSHIYSTFIWNTGSHGFHFAPNAVGTLLTDCHPYHLTQSVGAVGIVIEAGGMSLENCMVEGSDATQLAILAHDASVIGGIIFGNSGYAGVGIQLGQSAGDTVIPGQILQSAGTATANSANGCNIDTKLLNCTSGAMYFRNEGDNLIRVSNYQTSGGFLVSGTMPSSSDFLQVHQDGLTSDFTINTISGLLTPSNSAFFCDQFGSLAGSSFTASWIGGQVQAQTLTNNATISVPGNSFLRVSETANVTGIIIATQPSYRPSMLLVIVNESSFTVTFDTQATSNVAGSNGSNVVIAPQSQMLFWWDTNTQLWYRLTTGASQSSTAAATASSGTISTTGLDESRVAPTAAITGVILQAGTYAGQACTVVNESATITNSVTFAASGTSHVANGVAEIIPGLCSRRYVWDTGTSLWYSINTVPMQSATAVSTASSGTIATAGLDVSRVAPTAAVTGVILAAGTYAGQSVIVVNEATTTTFSVTFAASGTSNVANGVTEIIPGLCSRRYVWDSGTSLWYSVNAVPMQSATAASIAASGTINTAGLNVSRVTTSGAVSGVILQSGTYAGQDVTVVNESANIITFATSATSHVASGVSATVQANAARRFVWDSSTSLWYQA